MPVAGKRKKGKSGSEFFLLLATGIFLRRSRLDVLGAEYTLHSVFTRE